MSSNDTIDIVPSSRFLSSGNETSSSSSSSSDSADVPDETLLRTSLRLYGSIFIFNMLLFSVLKKHFPRAFNVRSWAPGLQSHLSHKTYGYIDWLWTLFRIPDDDIRKACGLDALTYLRALRFGTRVAMVGVFNSIFLLAVYGTAGENETDRIVSVTISNVKPGSNRLLATVLAAYILFGTTMYLLLKEFAWFTRQRHLFLQERKPRNYTVYVTGIPSPYRTNHKLKRFFEKVFSRGSVLEARVAVKAPALTKKTSARAALVQKLENVIDRRNITGTRPTHSNYLQGSEAVDSIGCWTEDLEGLNDEISNMIDQVERGMRPNLLDGRHNAGKGSLFSQLSSMEGSASNLSTTNTERTLRNPPSDKKKSLEDNSLNNSEKSNLTSASGSNSSLNRRLGFKDLSNLTQNGVNSGREIAKKGGSLAKRTARDAFKEGKSRASESVSNAKTVARKAVNTVADVASTAIGVKFGGGAEALDAGFVTFRKMSYNHAALQMIHHPTPYKMLVWDAPDPEDVFWHNVGKTHRSLMVGKLLSLGMTGTLCFFWTAPVTGIKQLTNVEYLRESVPRLDLWIDRAPFLESFLAMIAPVLILILTMVILPKILERISRFEGPIAVSALEVSVFVKMSLFMVVQTFFVSTISGTITSLSDEFSFDEVAKRIPEQSTYFMQIIVVRATVVGLSLELLRVVPFLQACLRKFLGPRMTEKERHNPFVGLRPLSNPYKVRYGTVFGTDILYFVVLFVYSTMAPLINFFLAFVFFLMGSGYRYQFIHNYPKDPDSGGLLFVGFVQVVQTCMVIAEVALFGYLVLKRAYGAVPFMFPLIGATLLFNLYLRQEHYKVAEYLTSESCLSQDLEDEELDSDIGEEVDFRNQYVQPELRHKHLYPVNFDERFGTGDKDDGAFEAIPEASHYLSEDEERGKDDEVGVA